MDGLIKGLDLPKTETEQHTGAATELEDKHERGQCCLKEALGPFLVIMISHEKDLERNEVLLCYCYILLKLSWNQRFWYLWLEKSCRLCPGLASQICRTGGLKLAVFELG